MEFKKITKEAMPIIKKYLAYQNFGTCDYTVGGIYMWSDYFNYSYLEYDDVLLLLGKAEEELDVIAFAVPFGPGDFEKALDFCHQYAKEKNMLLEFSAVPEVAVEKIKSFYNCRDGCKVTELVDWSDYVYAPDDLKYLKGKKYNSRRNHINYFLREFADWSFSKITQEDKPALFEYCDRFYEAHEGKSELFQIESARAKLLLSEFEDFGFVGGKLMVNGEIAGFSIGEKLNGTLFVHIEKASREIRGAYEMINMEFVKAFADETIEFINREEDVGDPGLRAAKKAYHPIKMLKKFNIAIK